MKITIAHQQDPQKSAICDVIVGRIQGPWGLNGDLKVEVLTDIADRFQPGSVLHIGDKAVKVKRVRDSKKCLVVGFDVIDDRTKAESLFGQYLTISKAQVEELKEGLFYHFQILDIAVWTEENEYLGKVKEILSAGSVDVYVISNDLGKDILIPALEQVVLKVDLKNSKMTVRLFEGLREE